ncbi:lipopolysaccharide biosynthesis protein-like protein [Burkholderia orbicola MC0-3]|uniref:Lipopolysaccharide biosynthesis protein-like protein n=2 Tax=Burkholderia TaxID=32008 RepID=B1JX12_BURO0|nr:lipopolysaccharide biosynthesis protein-like protein [Burkholderia cenocepacia]ACA90031.1 lipopolysaccharide biosynthesis protein-like protein [Burkholderia orbicola MC0-3]
MLNSSSVTPTLIVVLGMHRSGTSVLTRAMETLGADLGSRLMPAAAGNNDKGFFEDIDVNQINIDVMHAAGFDWDTMAPIDSNAIDMHRLDELRVKAAAMIRAKCGGKTFALKDPRIARLSWFWQPVLAGLQIRVVYVIAIRNPISVARSLLERDQFAEEKSHILWLAHTLSALEMSFGSTRTLMSYDALLDAPQAELTRISSELGLQLIESEAATFAREFIDGDLRHTRFAAEDLNLLHSAPRQVKALFAALDESVRSRLPADNTLLSSAARDARTYLDDISPLLRYEWQLDRQFHLAQASEKASDAALHDHQRATDTLHATIASLNETIHALEQQQQAWSQALQSAHTERDDAFNRQEELAAQLRLTHAALADTESKMTTASAELDDLRRSQIEILTSKSWRITSPLRAVKRLLKRA